MTSVYPPLEKTGRIVPAGAPGNTTKLAGIMFREEQKVLIPLFRANVDTMRPGEDRELTVYDLPTGTCTMHRSGSGKTLSFRFLESEFFTFYYAIHKVWSGDKAPIFRGYRQ